MCASTLVGRDRSVRVVRFEVLFVSAALKVPQLLCELDGRSLSNLCVEHITICGDIYCHGAFDKAAYIIGNDSRLAHQQPVICTKAACLSRLAKAIDG